MPHELAGKQAPSSILVDIPKLVASYYTEHPDPGEPSERVAFGTSGHRGTSGSRSFNEAHIAAVAQAVADYRRGQGIAGPLFMGADTHALSEPALRTATEVFAGNDVDLVLQGDGLPTPTPVVSHAILTHNRGRKADGSEADGVVITPSHNPPEDGGFKYNPPHGGPAGTEVTRWIENRANDLLAAGLDGVRRVPYARARTRDTTHRRDLVRPYVNDLASVLEMDAIAESGVALGVDPMGGAGLPFWGPIAERYDLDLTVVNDRVDPTFGFMTVDHDGKIRMDCSSPYAMARLIELKDRFDVAFGNDPDADRHGIVTRASGLMNPNHFLSVAVDYLFRRRDGWPDAAAVGKTLVSSSMIDRVTRALGRDLKEVPVGFKWFVDGLLSGAYGFAGEESAGASFLRRDGTVWSTDKDGIILALLAAEIMAVTGEDPAEAYRRLEERHGSPVYRRSDAPASDEQKKALASLTADRVEADTLAGEEVLAKLTHAPANDAPIGGLKVVTENGWFAARPSGTEDIYKIYAESFRGEDHLDALTEEAQAIVRRAFEAAEAV